MWFYVIAGVMIVALIVTLVVMDIVFHPNPNEGEGPE